MKWVDIGINLTNNRYDKDREQVIQAALDNYVDKLIITGTSIKESQKASKLAQQYADNCFSTAGCHPHDAKNFCDEDLLLLREIASKSQTVAIGECGLDFNRDFSPREQQIKVFKQQLELAVELQLPVFLHEREAFDTQYQILTDYMPKLSAAVSHCFTGAREHMEQYIDLGLSIGITGWICDERRGLDLFNIVKYIPDDRLMIETDGPYLTPRNLPKKPKDGRNEPKFLPHIAKTIAEARAQSLEKLSEITFSNSVTFFKLPN